MDKLSGGVSTTDPARLIELLLEEYRTLREEQIALTSGTFNFLGYAGAGVAVVVALGKDWRTLAITLAILVVLGVSGYTYSVSADIRICRQLSALERRVNDYARGSLGADADLLTWQTVHAELGRRAHDPFRRLMRHRLSD